MNCELCQQELSSYLDGELSEAMVTQLQEHLAACPECQAEYTSLQRVQEMLATVEVLDLNPGVWARVERQITRRRAPFLERISSFGFQNRMRRYVDLIPRPVLIGALAALLLVFAVFTFYQHYETRTLMTWVEQYSTTPVDLEVNPFSLQDEESLDENPFDTLRGVSLDLNINYFSPSDPLGNETLEKNPFST